MLPVFLTAEEMSNSISLSAVLGNPRFSDSTVSPLLYSGLTGGLSARYEYGVESYGFDAQISGYGGVLSNGYDYSSGDSAGPLDTDFGGGAHVGLWFKLPFGGGFILDLGGRLEWDFDVAFLTHMSMYDWVGDLSLSPMFRFEFNPERRSRFYWEVCVPVFSFLNRPSWTIYDNELDELASEGLILILFRGVPVSLDQYLKIRTGIGGEFEITDALILNAGFEAVYRHTELPRAADFLNLSVSMGVCYVF